MRDIDAIIELIQIAHPEIRAEQLKVLHPGADDDGLWFFCHPDSETEVQLESSLGNCPFLMESSSCNDRLSAETVQQAVALVVGGLGIGDARPNNSFKPSPHQGGA